MGNRLIDSIEGVFFVSWHAEWMRRRLSIPVSIGQQEEAEEEQEDEGGFET